MFDWSMIFGFANIILAVAVFYFARKKDTATDAAQQMEVVVQMRAVRDDVADIKSDMKAMREDWRQDHDDIVKMKSSLDAVWRRIDDYAKQQERKGI